MKLIMFLFCIISVYATPPTWTYRFDTRSPEQVFQSGFSARGNNDNIEQHVSGVSLRHGLSAESASAFIATTPNLALAQRWMGVAMAVNPSYNNHIWLYRIRTTNNFYDVNAALDYARHNDISLVTRNHAETLYARYNDQDEWVALDNIPNSQIMFAIGYRYNTQALQALPTEEIQINTHYVLDMTRANSEIYPILGRRSQQSNADRMLSLRDSLVSALMIAWCCKNKNSNDDTTDKCDNPDIMTFEYFDQHVTWCPSVGNDNCINKDVPFPISYYHDAPRKLLLMDD